MGGYININGKIKMQDEALLPADNRAFRYGYGLFETMLFRDGVIALKDLHWERLFASMQQLHFSIPKLFTKAYLEQEVERTVQKNKLEHLSRVRLQVFAGSGGLYEDASPKPEFVIECFPLEKHILMLNETGLVTGIAQELHKSNDALANLKSSNALIYAVAAQQAKANKWNDALIRNAQGNIVESTIANIFWTKDNTIYTPLLSEGCIAGVMRQYVIRKLRQQGFDVQESSLDAQILWQADSIFLTNAIRRIKWVQEVDDQSFSNHFIGDIYHSVFHTT
ncbi:MAG: 4-amino-4-deoxychorismate lyase [Sphingobacteriales bacterium]|nr:MAG: 4-amino-4-deoxychorismate lyase [Sphingobacteriales bacterium]